MNSVILCKFELHSIYERFYLISKEDEHVTDMFIFTGSIWKYVHIEAGKDVPGH